MSTDFTEIEQSESKETHLQVMEYWRVLNSKNPGEKFTEEEFAFLTVHSAIVPINYLCRHSEELFNNSEFNFNISNSIRTLEEFEEKLQNLAGSNVIACIWLLMISNCLVLPVKCKESTNFFASSEDDKSKISYLNQNKMKQIPDISLRFHKDYRLHANPSKVARNLFDTVLLDKQNKLSFVINLLVRFPYEMLNCSLLYWKYRQPIMDALESPGMFVFALGERVTNWPQYVETSQTFPPQRYRQVGRVLNKFLLEDASNFEQSIYELSYFTLSDFFSEKQFDDFNTKYRQESYKNSNFEQVKELKGEDIRKYYLYSNYESLSGDLGNSCMRYQNCQAFLDIYVKNTDIVHMAVILNEEDKLLARSIVWFDGDEYYHDRIYAVNGHRHDELLSYFLTKQIKSVYYNKVQCLTLDTYVLQEKGLKANFNLEYYPYMDSLKCLGFDNNFISNESDDGYYLEQTDGTFEATVEEDTNTCDHCDHSYAADNTVYVEHRGSEHRHCTLCHDCSVYSDFYGEHIGANEACFLEDRRTYVLISDTVEDEITEQRILDDDSVVLFDDTITFYGTEIVRLGRPEDCITYAHLEYHSDKIIEYKDMHFLTSDCSLDHNGVLVPDVFLVKYCGQMYEVEEFNALEDII